MEYNYEKGRPKVLAEYSIPGPNKYRLPDLIGCTNHNQTFKTEPAYTFRGRGKSVFSTTKCENPGPNMYDLKSYMTRFGRDRAPSARITNRPQNGKINGGPSPLSYPHEKQGLIGYKNSPALTMKWRKNSDKLQPLPATNYCYKLPPLELGLSSPNRVNVPKYSILGRIKDETIPYRSPGPAAYDISLKNNTAPAFTLHERTKDNRNRPVGPGPAKYNIRDLPSNIYKSSPRAKFGIRHSSFQYLPPYFKNKKEETVKSILIED